MRKRPPQATLNADRAALADLQNLPDYAPRNPACGIESLLALDSALERAEEHEARARWAYEMARNETTEAALTLHDMVQAAKIEVRSQYGPDSQALRAVGLKPSSERKRPVRRRDATAD